ncbi:MAG: aldehyde dehydrogenase (NADP(+)) [Agriterribacter sp.]
MNKYTDATEKEINSAMQSAWEAFNIYRKYSLRQRADFMRAIAAEMEAIRDKVIPVAMRETHLPEPRLQNEFARTIFQLTSYAAYCEQGAWLEARIDTAVPDRNPPKPDIRKTLVPLGPVVVFGASNFPFAYSTAGGDTACAFAAGCPVIVKAHPAHAEASEMVAAAIDKAVQKNNLPEGIFAHMHGAGFETGKTLVMHPYTKAVGFTGSYTGGKALFDMANQRKEPIPVFAEMGSINPVYLLPEKLQQSAAEIARQYAASVTLSVGQFCTNPGLIIGIDGDGLQQFITALGNEIKNIAPSPMLHPGIAKAFAVNRTKALIQEDVDTIAVAAASAKENDGIPTIASATATTFLNNPVLHQEVFGPYSIVIRCKDAVEMSSIIQHIEGQLTSTVIGTDDDIQLHRTLIDNIQLTCGRLIFNGVPTGVEVCLSMQHGGPFPATTDSRFTAVGADGIKRFARPVSYQNCPDIFLPEELKNENPLGLWRTVNNELTKDSI